MQSLYRLALRFSPEAFRRDFGDELLAVFTARMEDAHRFQFYFLFKELLSVLALGLGMRMSVWPGWPVAGGIGGAALLHLALYSIIGMVLRQTSNLQEAANRFGNRPSADGVILGFWGMFCVLGLLPLFVAMVFRVRTLRR